MGKQQTTIVAIDSNVLVWGFRRQGDPEKIKRAKWLFQDLDSKEAQVIIPSVAIAECLHPIPKHKRASTIAELANRFIIAPFDIQAADLAADLFEIGKSKRKMGKPDTRKCLRADSLIVATAKIHGAKIFYSNDKNCLKLAESAGGMNGQDLPTMPPDLFGYNQSQ